MPFPESTLLSCACLPTQPSQVSASHQLCLCNGPPGAILDFAHRQYSPPSRHPLRCAHRLFTRALATLKGNLAAVSGWPRRVLRATWAVVVYNNRTAEWARLPAEAARLGAHLVMLEDGGPVRTRAKLSYQLRFAALLGRRLERSGAGSVLPGRGSSEPPAEYVWLLDGDISLQRFRLDAFLGAWRCCFASGPPLVSQPPVLQSSQDYWHLNWRSWAALERRPAAVATDFIEIQTPIIDAGFFRSLASGRAQQLAEWDRRYDSDWGIDLLWCPSAREYDPSRMPCAVVLHPISHVDSKTMNKDDRFSRGGMHVLAAAQRQWPTLLHFPYHLAAQPLMRIPREAYRIMRAKALAHMLNLSCDKPHEHACLAREGLRLDGRGALAGVHIFWINADANVGRREIMEAEFKRLGIVNHTRVPAIVESDIRRLEAEGLSLPGLRFVPRLQSFVGDVQRANATEHVTYSYAELGRTLSHLAAARLAYETRMAASLVLEDSVLLWPIPMWTHSLPELMARAPTGWKILQLHTINAKLLRTWCPIATGFRRWERLHWSSAAYILSWKGAAGLSVEAGPLGTPGYARRIATFIYSFVKQTTGQASQATNSLVADNLIFQSGMPHTYTFARPLFALAPAEAPIHTADAHEVAERAMREWLIDYFSPSHALLPCAALSFSGSLARGTREGGERRHASTARLGCMICADGGVLHPELLVAGACIDPAAPNRTDYRRLSILPRPVFPLRSRRYPTPVDAPTCVRRNMRTRAVSCAELDGHFTRESRYKRKEGPWTSCHKNLGHLGCCDEVPDAAWFNVSETRNRLRQAYNPKL